MKVYTWWYKNETKYFRLLDLSHKVENWELETLNCIYYLRESLFATLLSNLLIFWIVVVLTGVVSVSPWCGNVTTTLTVETAATSRSVTGNTGLWLVQTGHVTRILASYWSSSPSIIGTQIGSDQNLSPQPETETFSPRRDHSTRRSILGSLYLAK